MRYHFSLHRTRTPKECDICGREIPALEPPDYAEYWRVKGGPRDPSMPRVICCFCHVVYGFPTDGWVDSPDGREVIAALHPAPGIGLRHNAELTRRAEGTSGAAKRSES